MPKERVTTERAMILAKRVRRITKLAGGLSKVTKGANVSHQVIYRLQGGACISSEKAERIEEYLNENESILKSA